MKLFKRIGLGLIILLLISYMALSWVLSNRVLVPTKASHEKTKEKIKTKWGTTYEKVMQSLPAPTDFSVNTFDNLTLRGKYFAASDTSNCAIIMAHGWNTTWADMLKYVPVVSDCGCDLIFYDHRAHGESDGKYGTGGINEAKDLLTVTDWVQTQKGFPDQRIGWLGSSWGAATVLQAGADKKNVGFIIADAPFQDWYSAVFERAKRDYGSIIDAMSFGVFQIVNLRADVNYMEASAIKLTSQIDESVLLIHSEGDQATNSQQSVNISKKLNTRSTFHHTPWDNNHVMDVVNNRDEMREFVQKFFANNQVLCDSEKGDFIIE